MECFLTKVNFFPEIAVNNLTKRFFSVWKPDVNMSENTNQGMEEEQLSDLAMSLYGPEVV